MTEEALLPSQQDEFTLRDEKRIRKFVQALHVALHDVELEQTARAGGPANPGVRFYYDADVCIRMIVGFEHHRTAHAPPTDEEEIVRALLASRVLGSLMLVPPYVWEIDDAMGRQVDFAQEEDVRLFSARAEKFIEKKNLREPLTDLSKKIRDGVAPADILKSFAEHAPQTFVALEAVNGTWRKRLERFARWGLMRFDATGWEIPELVATETGKKLQLAITEVRPKQKWLLNNLRDAAALTTLSQMIGDPARFGRVRFYSESDALWKMVEEDIQGVSYVLSYPPTNDGPAGMFDADCRHIFRNAYYYLVRARFSALRFPRGEVRSGPEDVSLGQLRTTAKELEMLLGSDEQERARRLFRVRMEGKPLSTIIGELESLSFVGSIWQKHDDLPDDLDTYLSEWTNLWEFLTTQGTVKLIDTEIRHLRDQFSNRLSLLKSWAEDLLSIRTAARVLREQCASSPPPEPMRDLGLVRWGATLGADQWKKLKSQLAALLSPSESEFEITVQQIASLLHRQSLDGQETIALAAILWLLGQFNMIVRVASQWSAHASPSDAVTLRVLAAAAALRGTLIIDPEAIEQELREVKECVEKRPAEEQARYLLGLAYVHYYAWLDAGEKEEFSKWGDASFGYAERAVERLQPNSLPWAFAVNHCVYVGFVTHNLRKAQTHRQQLLKLIAMSGKDDVWHYRFADTLAFTHYVVAMDRLRTLGDQPASAEVLKFIEDEWGRGIKYLQMADPFFGDSDIITHRHQFDELRGQLDALKLDQS
jgi:hypothetical protein